MAIQLNNEQYAKLLAALEAVEDHESWHPDHVPDTNHMDWVVSCLIKYAIHGASYYCEDRIALKLAGIVPESLDDIEKELMYTGITRFHDIQTIFKNFRGDQ